MFLSQLAGGGVIMREGDAARLLEGVTTTHELAEAAIEAGAGLAETARRMGAGRAVDLAGLAGEGALDLPIRHPDPAHMHLAGTGLTHTGSADTRDAMHADTAGMTDSMKMFRMGLEGGRPAPGTAGVQPEWFYKGTGQAAVAPGAALESPGFAMDAGEEPEIAGVYLIGPAGEVLRLGFCLANEFSDHAMERVNYLWLAHSKLRPASFGPEIRLGDLPADVQGVSRIRRDGAVLWERPFASGEANMSHTIANLEHHHFKYAVFRQPGDVHLHMFGTATLSFADGIEPTDGDLFEIEAPEMGLPLVNPLRRHAPVPDPAPAAGVTAL